MIRVVVVDDEALVRSGFAMILGAATDIEVVATSAGGSALSVVEEARPDVVLLDIRMPDIDGLTVLGRLMQFELPPAVGMLTTFDADEYVVTALRSGASGFLLKDTEPALLSQHVRTLAAGGVVLSPSTVGRLLYQHPETATRLDEEAARVRHLSVREVDVLGLVSNGLSNTEIGASLHLSTGTVKDHVSSILAKLRVPSRVQAALIAQRAGLLDQE